MSRRVIRPALLIACLTGCGEVGPNSAIESTTRPATPATPGPATPEPRFPHVAGLKFPPRGVTPGTMASKRAFPHLAFHDPSMLKFAADGSGRVFVLELAGRILVFPDQPSVREAKTFLQLPLAGKIESSLRSLAFDPDYSRNGRLYVAYTVEGPIRSIVSRFQVDPVDQNRALPESELVLLSIPEPDPIHNVGSLAFGPDGMLYISKGDGGGAGDPHDQGQDLGSLHGKVLRIDVSNAAPDETYRVPADNPFVGTKGARPEIWAYGLRNPWRMTIDSRTGEIWLGDVGQDHEEEINLIERGGNYGWAVREGAARFKGGADAVATRPPVYRYDHDQGRCVIGGEVYHGDKIPQLQGRYLFADLITGRVYALRRTGAEPEVVPICRVPAPISTAQSPDGQLYILSLDGCAYRLEPLASAVDEFPTRLSATGLFADTATLRPSPGLLPYSLNEPSWTDGAIQRNWIALPKGGRIIFDAEADWQLPKGAVLVQHFDLAMSIGDPSTMRRIETRILVWEEVGLGAYVYRWNETGTDADLDLEPSDLSFEILDSGAPRGSRQQRWSTPKSLKCFECHLHKQTVALGLNVLQLNRPIRYGRSVEPVEQLAAWGRMGMFSSAIPAASSLPRYSSSKDPRATLEDRARSYLAANCACCHRPREGDAIQVDLRYRTALSSANLIGVEDRRIKGWMIIHPGRKERSMIWDYLSNRGPGQMPPLDSDLVDMRARNLIGAWIDSLK